MENRITWMILVLQVLSRLDFGLAAKVELSGPLLTQMPPAMTHFSNSVGTTLTCAGEGPPPLSIFWLNQNGEELPQIPGIREQLENGSLYFGSFKPEDYMPSVHNGQYRCSVRNPVGTFLSPVFAVRAIVDHPFEVVITTPKPMEEFVEGSPALLSCDVSPSFYTQFVRIQAWKSIDQFGHETEISRSDSRYQVTSNGKLIILVAKYQQLFVCIGISILNQRGQASLPFLLKPKASSSGGSAPKRLFPGGDPLPTVVTIEAGKTTEMICLGVSTPAPTFRWEKTSPGKILPAAALQTEGVTQLGPVLKLSPVTLAHNGTYKCDVSNSLGSFSVDFILLILEPPKVTISPEKKVTRNGETVEISCKLEDDPSSSSSSRHLPDFVWFKDGQPFQRSSRMRLSSNKLLLFNVHLEDQGVYQCFTDIPGFSSVQAASSIVFEASAPELVHTFISQSLQPGPAISLKCSASGNPYPSISWSIDGQTVPPVSGEYLQEPFWSRFHTPRLSIGSFQASSLETISHLNVTEILVEDSGVYTCTAKNLVGFVQHSSRLNIYGSIFVKEMGTMTLTAGQAALIPCLYGGYPVDKIIWKKDSREIGLGKRFAILPNGTLQIQRLSTDSDKGRYGCFVSNRKGETAQGEVDVNVMRPPVISPFKFDDNLKEGQRTSVSCNVISGDLPIDIEWMKDGKKIPGELNVTENRVKFLSVLIFEELRDEHSGEYQCSGRNAAAKVKQKAELRVKVPPKWIREPADAKVILKSDHSLSCSAGGVPPPKVSWMRDSSGIKSAIKTDHKFQLKEDGSLRILQVEETDATQYICEAVNGVGPGLQRSIRLYVIIPAKVSALMTSLVVAEGLGALLKCQIRGDEPVQVIWKKDSHLVEGKLENYLEKRHLVLETKRKENATVMEATLRIEESERADSGVYECIASNQYGRDQDRILVEVKARPSPPENFIVEEIGSRFIRVRWTFSGAGQSVPVTGFILQWKKSSSGNSWESGQVFNMSVQSLGNHAVVEMLNPVTNYDVRVKASNDIGESFPTEPLAVFTLPEAPSGPAQNVSALPIGPKSVLVRWEPPEVGLQHGHIIGYQVTATLQSVVLPSGGNRSTIVDEKWGQQSELKDLRPNSQYRVSVRAYNTAGMGPESSPVFIQTPEGAPDSPPLNLHCEALSPKSLQVQWDPPPFHLSNGNILGYKVVYLPADSEKMGEKPEVKKTSNKETTLHGLKSFTQYAVKTLAYTLGGESETSPAVLCSTEEDVPDQPGDIKVMTLTSSSTLVSWLPPSSPNGVITKYTIFWKSDDSEVIKEKQFVPLQGSDEEQFSSEIRRLKENSRYTFWLSAATASGSGKTSKQEVIEISSQVPARIASFAVTKKTIPDQPVRLPCKAVGMPSPRITWTKNSHPLTSSSLIRNGSLFISRVKDADEGVYLCRVDNEHGQDGIEHRVIISRPPGQVQVFLGYVTDTSLQIHWDSPERAEPALTGYTLQYQQVPPSGAPSREWNSLRLGPRLTSVPLENLLCGTPYNIKILGENSVGRGEPSQVLKARTNGAPPEQPRLTEILDGNGTMIRIDLSRWSDGGCAFTNFQIEYKKTTGSGNQWVKIYKKDNSSRVFIFQTEPSSKYQIKIRVENDAGSVSKVFRVESHPDFFTNYAKVLERVEVEEKMNGSYVSLYTDPHVLVPIVSAVICTFAVAVCVLMLIKRKNHGKSDWKFKQSSSQQTWLSSSDGGKCGHGENGGKCGDQGCTGNMSIYATLNSTKPIPMTIRDSTVRFQTFGQHDNYEAPMIPGYLKRSRRKSNGSSPLEEMCMQQVSCQMEFPKEIEPPREFRSSSIPSSQQQLRHHHQLLHLQENNSDSDDNDTRNRRGGGDDDGLYHDYSCPYQYAADNRREIDNHPQDPSMPPLASIVRPGTLKKKHTKSTRSRGSTEYLE